MTLAEINKMKQEMKKTKIITKEMVNNYLIEQARVAGGMKTRDEIKDFFLSSSYDVTYILKLQSRFLSNDIDRLDVAGVRLNMCIDAFAFVDKKRSKSDIETILKSTWESCLKIKQEANTYN